MKRSKALGFLVAVVLGSVVVYSLFSKNVGLSENNPGQSSNLIPPHLLDRHGKTVTSDIIKGKYIGLYFSASWCGPCRSFTPELIKFRNQHQDKFEVVLVGGDGSPKEQAKYVKKYEMPWYAMSNQCKEAKNASQSLKVDFIPYLVILDPSGNVVSKNGVSELRTWKSAAMNRWMSKSVKGPA